MPTFEITYTVTTTLKTTIDAKNDMEACDIIDDDEITGLVITVDQETEIIDIEQLEN